MAVPSPSAKISPMHSDKVEMRRMMRAARAAFVAKLGERARAQAAVRLKDVAFAEPAINRTAIWGGYNAAGSELDPIALTATTRWTDAVSARPWFADRSSEMLFRKFAGAQEPGPFNVLQPSASSPLLEPDTVLVPLLAVDLKGNRLGQGGGHYDRALRRLRGTGKVIAVGIAWECQIVDAVPAESWDEPLDFVATPERIIRVTG
jgi:5-formyltetrahydrofolate cyclo-ligase